MSFYVPKPEEIILHLPEISKINFIKKGGYKAVYKCQIEDSTEALKLANIPISTVDNEENEVLIENIERIKREINILEKCNTPFIVKLGKLKPKKIEINDINYVAYSEEFIEGKSLEDLIMDKHIPDELELRILATCLLKSVKHIWENLKTVHRDIKPLNVMKTSYGARPFILLDFGIAFAINDTPLTQNPLGFPGSLLYLAPEMFNPNFRETIDFRSDLYHIGVCLYEYATGTNPLTQRKDNIENTVNRILNLIPVPIKDLRDELSNEFADLINQLLKKIPALRPSNLNNMISIMEKGL